MYATKSLLIFIQAENTKSTCFRNFNRSVINNTVITDLYICIANSSVAHYRPNLYEEIPVV